jgi:hypothetical protein
MPSRREFLCTPGALYAGAQTADETFDVAIYGATPAGIAAALAAADDGERVVLLEPTKRIGGMITSGLSHTDFRTFEGLSGAFLNFSQEVIRHYTRVYGPGSAQVRDSVRGTNAEPEVNLQVFERLLAARKSIRVVTNSPLESAERQADKIRYATCRGRRFAASVFVDASYEGDLMAAAGVEFRIGREGRAEYGESLAPEQPDGQLQAYNFRPIATKEPGNRVTPRRPSGYKREDFAGVLPLFADGRLKTVFGYPSECVFKAEIPNLPNGKYVINDVSNGVVRMSLPGENLGWPEGDAKTRQRIFDEHLLWNVGLLWFLQNDPEIPDRIRAEAREWGWCKDEFVETGHLPPQLYVREARRMKGPRVYTEADTAHAPGDARGILHRDSIAVGDYSHNCHGTGHEGPRFGGRHTGEFYKAVPPYQIPYGVLVPREVSNLLVPVAASSSHVGFCALRLEPIWMALGQAAGHAAHLARPATAAKVSIETLQRRLWSRGAATIYVSDIRPNDPDFEAVQWWGANGGLHGLFPMPEMPGMRGKNIQGQYFEAYPFHTAELDRALDGAIRDRWVALGAKLGVTAHTGARTRKEFLRAAWAAGRGRG